MKTRQEHIAWCKERAHRAYEYDKAKGSDFHRARRNAIASILSDLGKHPETEKTAHIGLLLSMTVIDETSLFRFIDGWN